MLSRPALGPTPPPIQWIPGALSPGLKRSGREADHPSPTSAEVKKIWIYTFIPPYAFMAQCLISQVQGQFYLKTLTMLVKMTLTSRRKSLHNVLRNNV
jgi:hypothetical protein